MVSNLNTERSSPIFNRVVTSANSKKTFLRCLTQTSLSDGLNVSGLLGSVKKDLFVPGPFSHHDPQKFELSLSKASIALEAILELFRKRVSQNWDLGDRPGGYQNGRAHV
mgnify:CR=1 FL=1